MDESNSVKAIDRTSVTEQTKIRLNKITEIKNYFYEEISQRKWCSKKSSKYIATFDYVGKILIVLSAKTGGVSISSFTSIVGEPVRIASASFTLIFSLITAIVKKLLSITRNKKEKHDKIFLCWVKVNWIPSKHYEKRKENLTNENEKQEIMIFSSI